MRQRVDELYQQIKDAQAELEVIKENCPHENYRIMYYSWRPGSMVLKRLCSDCDQVVGDPTEAEEAEYKSQQSKHG